MRSDCAYPKCHSASRYRFALSLIELACVLAIISLLLAISLPAVQHAREAARQIECQNRLRQVGLAASGFQNAHGFFPSNGGRKSGSVIVGPTGIVQPYTRDFDVGRTFYWGVGSTQESPRNQPGSWAYSLLPFLELGTVQQDKHYQPELAAFRCPSRARPIALPPVADIWGNYEGAGQAMAKTDFAGNGLAFRARTEVLYPAEIIAGLSQTVAVGEKSFVPEIHIATTWYWDEPIYLGGSHGTVRFGSQLVPDGDPVRFRDQWGSAHPGTAHFVFFDGHVETISGSIDRPLMFAKLNIDR